MDPATLHSAEKTLLCLEKIDLCFPVLSFSLIMQNFVYSLCKRLTSVKLFYASFFESQFGSVNRWGEVGRLLWEDLSYLP